MKKKTIDPKKIESLVTKELKKYVEPKYMPKVKEKVLKMVNKDINKMCNKPPYKEFFENIDGHVTDLTTIYVQSEFALCEIQDIN